MQSKVLWSERRGANQETKLTCDICGEPMPRRTRANPRSPEHLCHSHSAAVNGTISLCNLTRQQAFLRVKKRWEANHARRQTHCPGGLRRKKHGLAGIKQLQQTEQNRMPSDLKAHLFERDSH